MRAILTTPTLADFGGPSPSTAPSEAKRQRRPSLDDIVSSCIRDANGDPATAALLLEDRVKGNNGAIAELARPYLPEACWKVVRQKLSATIGLSEDLQPQLEQTDTSARLAVLADSLLDFRLPNGALLRDAFAGDLREAARWYLTRSETLGRRGRWLATIADMIPRGRAAGDVFQEADLEKLYERCLRKQ